MTARMAPSAAHVSIEGGPGRCAEPFITPRLGYGDRRLDYPEPVDHCCAHVSTKSSNAATVSAAMPALIQRFICKCLALGCLLAYDPFSRGGSRSDAPRSLYGLKIRKIGPIPLTPTL